MRTNPVFPGPISSLSLDEATRERDYWLSRARQFQIGEAQFIKISGINPSSFFRLAAACQKRIDQLESPHDG